MKKLLLASAISAFSITAFAQSPVDDAQPRPDSTVTQKVVTETQTTVSTVQDGKVVSTVSDTAVTPSEDITKIEPPAKALPAPAVADSSLDLEATMKWMGRNFKKLKSAEGDLAAMKEPAAELAKWASQAEALGLSEDDGKPASEEQKTQFLHGMQTLRKQIADLEAAIDNGDADTVQVLLNEMGATRKDGHKYFDVK